MENLHLRELLQLMSASFESQQVTSPAHTHGTVQGFTDTHYCLFQIPLLA